MSGRTIKLFIMDSKYKNLKSAELSNWTGKAFIGERKHSLVLQGIDELKNATGIYFLLSEKEEETRLYIGEADNSASRIREHIANKEKEWFEKFIIFISKDANLTKAHVRYLEKELFTLTKDNLATIKLDNKTCPPGSNLPPSDIADMDVFLENMIFILNNLGVIDFAKTPREEAFNEDEPIFYINLKGKNKDKQAKLITTENGYKLLKGSYLEKKHTNTFEKTWACEKKKELLKKGLISEHDDSLLTNEDIYFKSPSGASDFVRASSTNGRTLWKLNNGTTIEEYESGIN